MDFKKEGLTEEVLKKIVKEAISESKFNGCDSDACKEKCGITTLEHAQEHLEWRAFKIDFDQLKGTIRNTIITVIIVALLSCAGLGIAFTINKTNNEILKGERQQEQTTTH